MFKINLFNIKSSTSQTGASLKAQYFVQARLIYFMSKLRLVVKLSWLIFFLFIHVKSWIEQSKAGCSFTLLRISLHNNFYYNWMKAALCNPPTHECICRSWKYSNYVTDRQSTIKNNQTTVLQYYWEPNIVFLTKHNQFKLQDGVAQY